MTLSNNPPPPPSTTEEKLMEFQSEFQRSQAAMAAMMQAMQATMLAMQEKLDRRSPSPPQRERERDERRGDCREVPPRDEGRGDRNEGHQDRNQFQENPRGTVLDFPKFTSLAEKIDRMSVKPPSSRSHLQSSTSLSPRQSETKSIESITPAPILQDSVNRFVSPSCTKQVVTEEKKPADLHLIARTSSMQQPGSSNLPSFAANRMSNSRFQEFCSNFGVNPLILSDLKQVEPVAVQVFEETPEPSVKAVGDEGRKSQKPEAPQSNHSAKVSGNQRVQIQKFNESKVHIHKSNEFLIDSLMDDDKLEMSWCVNKV